jgi:hypothetical protein
VAHEEGIHPSAHHLGGHELGFGHRHGVKEGTPTTTGLTLGHTSVGNNFLKLFAFRLFSRFQFFAFTFLAAFSSLPSRT